jgi:putative flippase GtrA
MLARLAGLRVSRFALVGAGATLVYAMAASLLSGAFGAALMPAASASLAAYAIAAVFSYAGHKYMTFTSDGAHRLEVPRFAALTGLGLVFAWMLPLVLVDGMDFGPAIPIALTCVTVPVVNYVVLDRWVFSGHREQVR